MQLKQREERLIFQREPPCIGRMHAVGERGAQSHNASFEDAASLPSLSLSLSLVTVSF